MHSFRADDRVDLADAWASPRSELLRDALRRLLTAGRGPDVQAYTEPTADVDDENALVEIADWGRAEDWADWADAARWCGLLPHPWW